MENSTAAAHCSILELNVVQLQCSIVLYRVQCSAVRPCECNVCECSGIVDELSESD